jgi:GH15 family glucan-1,4-alpha-glucosidase
MRIDDLALLSDCRTAALADREGSIVWFSPGRFDAASIFGRLLDPGAGHWTIRPRGDAHVGRGYEGDGPVLRTTFRTGDGEAHLTDALALRAGTGGHGMEGLPATHLVRRAECTRGSVELDIELVARPEYGLTTPHLERVESGWVLSGGREDFHLVAAVEHRVEDDALRGSVRLEAGETAEWILAAGEADGRTASEALAGTMDGWSSWQSTHEAMPGEHADAVRRSAMVLQALTYAPTGVVIAAPTTSLPERIGEAWNWDYRYAWLRDLSFVVHALWVAACPDEPVRYLDWLARAIGRMDGDHVQIMFGVEGERDLSEHTLDHLDGFAGSRPVRIGNSAWNQKQLDVLGEVVDSAHLMRDYLGDPVSAPVRDLLVGLADRAATTWREPDNGMWEARDQERHYLSSKVMCWVAVDRAVRLARRLDAVDRIGAWTRAREEIRSAVLDEGWSPDVKAFTGAFGSDELDASVLLMPLVGIVDGDDERMMATLDRIEEQLASDAGVQRWADEGSAFLLCGFWLSECLVLAGRRERAEERFAATAASANDLGLMAEEVSRDGTVALGNFPQALSHVGLINAAWRLANPS